jgi:biopolymer transport protein ExbD
MKLPRRHPKRGRVEIIPMIDTILILLIFYMSFSSFKVSEKRIDARLPVLNAKVTATKIPLDISIHVRSRNEVVVNGTTTFDLISLRDAMMTLGAMGQEATIVIEAEPDTSYRDVIGALDACALAKLTKVAFRPLAGKGTATP